MYNLTLVVIHVNHQLRGEESERDALFVEQQAARLAIPFYQTRVYVTALQRGSRISLQQAARQLRYSCFHTLCQTLGAARVALGIRPMIRLKLCSCAYYEVVALRVWLGFRLCACLSYDH